MKWILGTLVVVFGLVLLIMIIRGLRFKPKNVEVKGSQNKERDGLAIGKRFSKMIQCKTISYPDEDKMNMEPFRDFQELIKNLYPLVHEQCQRSFHGKTGILYRWKGKERGKERVLMSHYDVVPCNEALWSKDPFSGAIEEGYIWGRGTLDTKATLCGILEAAEGLIKKGFQPKHDIYFSFSGDEEISGESAPAMVSYLESLRVTPELVLDEGGAIVQEVFPGVSKPVAVVGIGEKGYLDVSLSLTGQGGHSSAPPAHSLVGQLSKAVVALEKKPFKARLTAPVREMFDQLGRQSTFLYRMIFANLWFFSPLLKVLFTKQGGEMNALIRTTTAVTMMQGSKAFNVLPPMAKVGINFRLLTGEDVESALDYIRKIIGNPDIELQVEEKREASPVSPTKAEAWEVVEKAIHKTWNGVVVSPYLMLAASDARHYCKISEKVYRFSAMPLSKEERGLIHGNDERIRLENLGSVVEFYENLMEDL